MDTSAIVRNQADPSRFNQNAILPFQLRLKDFELAMQDVYDFFYDVNVLLVGKDCSGSTICYGLQSCRGCFPTC
jgi:hypothetical protein